MGSKFEVLDAYGPDWPSLPTTRRLALLRALQDPTFRRDSSRRFGFREFSHVQPDVFAGYFVIEGRLSYLTYDESGAPPQHDELPEFERVLAVLLVTEGRWIVHERRFFRTDLNKALVRERFQDALRLAHSAAGFAGSVRLQAFERNLSNAEMLRLLRESPALVTRIEIADLHRQHVPDDYHFYNPRYDLDREVHLLVDGDLDVLENAEFRSAASADVRGSRIAAGLAHAGSVDEFGTQDAAGQRRRVRRSIPAIFELDVDPEDDGTPLATTVGRIVAAVREGYPGRYQHGDAFAGGLFEGLVEETSGSDE